MFALLVRLVLIMAVAELGLGVVGLRHCRSRACLVRIERRARDILRVDSRPISVFPEEARRFR